MSPARGRDGRAYFGLASGQIKGQNPSVTGAMDGRGSATKRACQSLLGPANSMVDKDDLEARLTSGLELAVIRI